MNDLEDIKEYFAPRPTEPAFNLPRYYDRDGRIIDGGLWARLFERPDYMRVLWTRLRGGKRVSTVWLGLNHNFHDDGPPLIFESMVFGHNGDSLVMQRYTTEAVARLGHWLLVRQWSYNRWQRRRLARRIAAWVNDASRSCSSV